MLIRVWTQISGTYTGKNLPITRIVNPISHWFSSQWKSFSTVVFQYPIRYTILHVFCTSTWSLAPFIQHFHNNCTMDDLKNPTEIQLFILQDKLQLLGMVQFCCFCTLWKYWELGYYPTHLQCYNEINNCCLCNIFSCVSWHKKS